MASLMQRWEVPVRRFIFRLIGNDSEAEDLAQEVFVKLYLKRASYRSGARFSTWVFTLAANLSKNRLRWWRRRPTLSLNAWLEEGLEPEDVTVSPSQLAMKKEQQVRAAAVQAAVARLPVDQRTALVLFEFEAKSMSEIAEIEGCTSKAIENRLYRARLALRGLLGAFWESTEVM